MTRSVNPQLRVVLGSVALLITPIVLHMFYCAIILYVYTTSNDARDAQNKTLVSGAQLTATMCDV